MVGQREGPLQDGKAGRPIMEESQLEGTQAGEGSAGGVPDVDVAVEKLRETKLMGFLRELERRQGRMETASLLGVNYKTVARALDEDRLTGRVADALELLLGAGGDSEMARLRREVERLAERVAALEERGGDVLPVAPLAGDGRDVVRGGADGDGEDGKPAAQTGDGNETVQPQAQHTAPPVQGLNPSKSARRRRVDPEMVTREPAGDDPEVYGDAWPLVQEWRKLKSRHPAGGSSLSWLEDQERLLVLELAMFEEHELTVPPATQPVKGLARRDHTRWRWKALYRTQASIRKRKLLRWIRRILTLWLWRN